MRTIRPMRAKPGDKTQVPQQYGCQYKFDACNMSFSPRNLTSVSVVSRYARRDVTFACPAMRRWQREPAEAGARQPGRFPWKQVRVGSIVVPRRPTASLCPYCARTEAPRFTPRSARLPAAFQRAVRATRSPAGPVGPGSPRIVLADVPQRSRGASSPRHRHPILRSPRPPRPPRPPLRIDPARSRCSQPLFIVYLITAISCSLPEGSPL